MVLANWSIGTECLMHSCAMIGVTWATLKVFQGSMPSTIFLYIFNVRNPCKNVISIFYTLKPKRLNELLILKHLLDIDIILDIFSMPSIKMQCMRLPNQGKANARPGVIICPNLLKSSQLENLFSFAYFG